MIITDGERCPQILIVDNDVDSREALADVLEEVGYCASCVGDGDEALERLEGGPAPVAIVLNPDQAGWTARPFWEDSRYTGIPLLLVTSQGEGERGTSLPVATERFVKPVNIPALLGAIATCRMAARLV